MYKRKEKIYLETSVISAYFDFRKQFADKKKETRNDGRGTIDEGRNSPIDGNTTDATRYMKVTVPETNEALQMI